jgi:hypothetical protein
MKLIEFQGLKIDLGEIKDSVQPLIYKFYLLRGYFGKTYEKQKIKCEEQ